MAKRKTFAEGEPLALPDEIDDVVAPSSAAEAELVEDVPQVVLPAPAESAQDDPYCERPPFWNWNH